MKNLNMISRRSFLKAALAASAVSAMTLTGCGGAASGSASSAAVSSSAAASGSTAGSRCGGGDCCTGGRAGSSAAAAGQCHGRNSGSGQSGLQEAAAGDHVQVFHSGNSFPGAGGKSKDPLPLRDGS